MANYIGAIFLIIVICVVVLIFYFMRKSKATSGYAYKHNVLIDLETGFECPLAVDYSNPDDLIKYDPNTQEAFVRREKSMFDKADDRIKLGDDYWDSKERYSGWRVIFKNIKVINEFILQEAQKWRRKWLDLKAELDVIKAENLKLKAFVKGTVKENLELMTDTHKEMITYYDPKKAGAGKRT